MPPKRSPADRGMIPSTHAYHVTAREGQEPPHLKVLQPRVANDAHFDGCLYGLPLVFLSSTRREGELPTHSVYPTHGTPHSKYQRYVVELKYFDSAAAYYHCKKPGQVHIVFIPLKHALWKHFEDLVEEKVMQRLPSENGWLERSITKARRTKWYVNDYDKNKVFVNIAFPSPLRATFCDLAEKGLQKTNQAQPTPSSDVALEFQRTIKELRSKLERLSTEARVDTMTEEVDEEIARALSEFEDLTLNQSEEEEEDEGEDEDEDEDDDGEEDEDEDEDDDEEEKEEEQAVIARDLWIEKRILLRRVAELEKAKNDMPSGDEKDSKKHSTKPESAHAAATSSNAPGNPPGSRSTALKKLAKPPTDPSLRRRAKK